MKLFPAGRKEESIRQIAFLLGNRITLPCGSEEIVKKVFGSEGSEVMSSGLSLLQLYNRARKLE
jgi:hypothetical protein